MHVKQGMSDVFTKDGNENIATITFWCGIPIVFLKYTTKGYNTPIKIFDLTIVDCSCVFQLPQSNHYQVIYQKSKKEIICI